MKKALMAALMLAALAVAPAVAQARVTLKTPSGIPLASHAGIELQTSNLYLQNGNGNLFFVCQSELEGTLSGYSNPAAKLTRGWSSCTGSGMKEEFGPVLPVTLSLGEEAGSGVARIPNAAMKLVYRSSKGALLGECTYKGDFNGSYEFGSELQPIF